MIHISKRVSMPKWQGWLIRLAAVGIALLVNAALIYALTKLNPIRVYITMFQGAFGTQRRIWNTLADTAMLLCIGVGLAPAFKMKFWNIGAEGQILVGGLASAACMIYFKSIPSGILLLIMFILSGLAGGIWGAIPAVSKVKLNTNETLFTLMMNYIAIQLTSYFVALWENPKGSNCVNIINPDTNIGWFPAVFGRQYLLNVVIVMIMVVLMYLYLKRTKHGYEIAVVGASKSTARYAAIDVNKVTIRTVSLSGAICGIAGFIAVAGQSHTISTNTAGGKGFIAIIVAWLSKFNTFVMILVSLLLVFLDKGAREIASKFNINDHMSKMIMGIILFFILGSEFFINYKINSVKSEKKEVK
ncbi:MAG: ABC transporter permease [Eubacteriales bacterium]|nr:ABC transporter permease [Clostridiales bacterium]MDD7688365.1 ABC transporter permease [Clostridiales bacterium]MDY2598189.1 ABC transporter permease [Eubacteriales bacterium]MDY3309173.1 ABC transporter permease [Eubacteriales bacterium]MDY5703062.1 ABC transporter permease [Eubacteriales bacterium]